MTLSVNLSHRLGDFALDVAFEAGPGVTALFGRSGAGKTTVVNAIAGLVRPDRGRIVAGGAVLTDTVAGQFVPPASRRVGYVFQDARLFPHLTVRQNLLFGHWFTRGERGGEFGRIVDLLGLGALLDRRPRTLSGGETSRVALGRAILSSPRLLLMDEPLAALDDTRKAEILPYVERMRDDLHIPVVYVSHSLSEVARLADTVVLIDDGRVLAAGPAAGVLSDLTAAATLSPREAGALIRARVEAHDDDGLTRLSTAAGPLWVPRLHLSPGRTVRLRIHAQDVMLATVRPEAISALNVLPAVVTELRPADAAGALVRLSVGDDLLLARITARSAARLGIAPGSAVFAIVKAVSVAGEDIGQAPGTD